MLWEPGFLGLVKQLTFRCDRLNCVGLCNLLLYAWKPQTGVTKSAVMLKAEEMLLDVDETVSEAVRCFRSFTG